MTVYVRMFGGLGCNEPSVAHFSPTSRLMMILAQGLNVKFKPLQYKTHVNKWQAASSMRPRWLFCRTSAVTCLFNLLTALTQKSPRGRSNEPSPPPLQRNEPASFYSGPQWEYHRHTDNIWRDTFGSHFPSPIFFFTSSLKWNVSCSCLLANKNADGVITLLKPCETANWKASTRVFSPHNAKPVAPPTNSHAGSHCDELNTRSRRSF